MQTDMSRIARLAAVKVTGPCFSTVPFNELTMFLCLHDRFERHFNRLGFVFRSQNFLGSSDKPVIES